MDHGLALVGQGRRSGSGLPHLGDDLRPTIVSASGEGRDSGDSGGNHHQHGTGAGCHPYAERQPGPPRLSWHFEQLLP